MSATVKAHNDQTSLAATPGLILYAPGPCSSLSLPSQRHSTGSPSPDGYEEATNLRASERTPGLVQQSISVRRAAPRSALHLLWSFDPEEIKAHPEHRLGRRTQR